MNLLKKITLFFLILFAAVSTSYAQSLIVVPQGYILSNGQKKISPKLLFQPDSSVYLNWPGNINSLNIKMKIGTNSGTYNYTNGSFPMNITGTVISDGTYRTSFVPADNGLSTGRYYAIFTNSQFTSLSDIINDSQSIYSNEFQIIVVSPTAPVASAPLGTINDPTPIFQWSSVSGVASYWLLLSSNPFEVTTDSLGNLSIQGANLVWNYTTNQTSAQYGDINPLNPYDQGAPPPLISGATYNYVILNLYEENNPIFGSTEISGINEFTYEDNSVVLDPPVLLSPAINSIIDAEPTISFTWTGVDWANNYTIYLFQRVTSFEGSDQTIDLPVWNASTTNTMVDYPAGVNLNKGKYVWYVIGNDDQGGGFSSETFEFDYNKQMAAFRLTAHSTLDNSALSNYQAEALAIQGGITPANPFLVTNSQTLRDSLAVGTYLFTGSKVGFQDTTIQIVLSSSDTESNPHQISFPLTPLPVILSGSVVDFNSGSPLSNVSIDITNTVTGNVYSTATASTGNFSLSVVPGSYILHASLAGYVASDEISINAANGQVNIPAISLVKDEAYVSGKILNDLGVGVQLAEVTAVQGNSSFSTISSGSGSYSFTLSSGQWNISAVKSGFVSPDPMPLNLSTGDNLQNQNIVIIPRANQISGTVTKVIDLENGGTTTTPFGGITVIAQPLTGSEFTATTDNSGNYSFSLRGGTYQFSVYENGYTSSGEVQLTFDVGETIENINFLLTPNPSSISGTVSLPDGAGLQDATVSAGNAASAVTNQNGIYNLSVPAGTHILSVSKPQYVAPANQTISISPGQSLTGINFTMTPNAGVISGVISSGGSPLNSASVSAADGSTTLNTSSDNSGGYSFSVQPGVWTISVSKQGFLTPSSIEITIAPGQQSSNNNFVLVQNIASITGVTNSNSLPLKNCDISVEDIASDNIVVNTVSNLNGQFNISVEGGKSYKITASKSGYASASAVTDILDAGSAVSITLSLSPNPASVSGKIYSDAGGTLQGISVGVYSESGTLISSAVSGSDGGYEIGLNAGNYLIKASAPGYLPDSSDFTVAVGQNLGNVDLTLNENFASVSGVVSGLLRSGIQGVLVNFISDSGGKTIYTLDDGSYFASRLIGAAYSISFTKPGFSDTTINNYIINDGENKILNVGLFRQNGVVSGIIKTAGGQTLADATVRIEGPDGVLLTSSNQSGEYNQSALGAGNYVISAQKSGYRSSLEIPFAVTASDSVFSIDIDDFALNTARVTGAVIEQGSSQTLSGAAISISGDNGSGSGVSNSSGIYSIDNLIPGNYILSAFLENYAFTPITINILDTSNVITKNIEMIRSTGSIVGRAVDQLGGGLNGVTVKAISNARTYSAVTASDGGFIFNDIEPDSFYTVKTDIFADGVQNAELNNVNVSANSQTSIGDLVVHFNTSKISGNVETGSASISLIQNNSTVEIVQSNLNGDYLFDFLPDGSYVVKPVKQGYVFSPSQKSVQLGIDDEKTVDFSSQPNIGDLVVFIKDEGGNPLSDVNVSVVNSDTNNVYSSVTGENGVVKFLEIPADSYIVTPSKSGFSSSPVNRAVQLAASDSMNLSFTLTANSASFSGKIFKKKSGGNIPLADAVIKLKNESSGEVYRTVSESDGKFSLSGLPRIPLATTIQKTGFVSQETEIDFSAGAVNKNFVLVPTTVSIRGKITAVNSADAANINISAQSNFGEFTAVSNSSGRFFIDDLPVSPDAGDTTIYNVSLNKEGLSRAAKLVKISSASIGDTITVPEFLLPGGKIQALISDCASPLNEVTVTMIKPDGASETFTTDESGVFESSGNLYSGDYSIKVNKNGYISPTGADLTFVLESDTSRISRQILMPYKYTAPTSILANEKTELNIELAGACGNIGTDAKIFYRTASASSFTEIEMGKTSEGFSGEIPALYTTEEITFYVQAFWNGDLYKSQETTLTPKAAGILSQMIINPEFNNVTLRLDDEYQASVILRDGVQNSLNDKFTGSSPEGSLSFEIPDGLELIFSDKTDSADFIIRAKTVGNHSLKITAKLHGTVISKTAVIYVSELPINSLKITSQTTSIPNTSAGIQFHVSASDSNGVGISLGSSLRWQVSPIESLNPSDLDDFTAAGFFVPVDSTYIGDVTVTVTDDLSGLSADLTIAIYADIYSTTNTILTNGRGVNIWFPANSVTIPIQVKIENKIIRSVKKYITPLGRKDKFVVSDVSYHVSYNSTTALPGDSLHKSGSIEIPGDESLKFNEGLKGIGFYDRKNLTWRILTAALGKKNNRNDFSAENFKYNNFTRFGEYAIVSKSEPLGLKYAAVLPSPFSPEVAPVKIGYFLTSDKPPVTVTIKIYNINGELVKTILDGDIQFPGRYGSSSSLKEITWDGSTDWGGTARNGRYIIHITAKDGLNETSKLMQVVLIK